MNKRELKKTLQHIITKQEKEYQSLMPNRDVPSIWPLMLRIRATTEVLQAVLNSLDGKDAFIRTYL